MSARARAYQSQITGRTGQAYVVDGVKFDGFIDNVLVDAKGPGYANFVKDGKFQNFFQGQQNLVKQARDQLAAAKGTPITWDVAETEAVAAIKKLFHDNGITGINVVHVPAVP